MGELLNIAATLTETARQFPDQCGVVVPHQRGKGSAIAQVTFRELDQLSDRLAAGMRRIVITPGTRIVLMVRPGIEFIALTYALFKAGAVVVLIDPGMGPKRVFRCLDQVEPEGFVAISPVQALRTLSVGRFPKARFNVTVGRRWFWGGPTYANLAAEDAARFEIAPTRSTDPAAIIFTSGSTGPAKGVVYEHGMFAAQVDELREYYGIASGGLDLPGFPLFALFNAAMGMTTVIPEMDPTRPAQVDPEKIVRAILNERVTQGFGSPAIWKRVGPWCEARQVNLPSLQRVFSAGAPVPVDVLASMKKALTSPGAEMHTPYGATEALPVCSISATEVLSCTAARTRAGAGTCVGHPFPGIRLKIIRISDAPLADISLTQELPVGEIGEIIVRGSVVTREYFRQPEGTKAAKISDGDGFWHRMGDVGYLDAEGALWFCGRKGHRVETGSGTIFTDCVEPVFNTHPRVARCALVGVGRRPDQVPVIVIEAEGRVTLADIEPELRQIAQSHDTTRSIERFLVYPGSLPVDVRHNIKINREALTLWATKKLASKPDAGSPVSEQLR